MESCSKNSICTICVCVENKGTEVEEQGTTKLKTRGYKNYFNNIDLFY